MKKSPTTLRQLNKHKNSAVFNIIAFSTVYQLIGQYKEGRKQGTTKPNNAAQSNQNFIRFFFYFVFLSVLFAVKPYQNLFVGLLNYPKCIVVVDEL